MTREDELAALAEWVAHASRWLSTSVNRSRAEGNLCDEELEAVVVCSASLDRYVAGLEKASERLLHLTGATGVSCRATAEVAHARPARHARTCLRVVETPG